MELILEITEGDRQGTRFEVKPGLSIGRKNTDILLRDSKVSSLHAVVELREDTLYLVDKKSSNGIKVDGKRVQELALDPGVTFCLGRTTLTVIEVTPAPVIEPWTTVLSRWTDALRNRVRSEPFQLSTFNPLLKLKFIQGRQTGTLWTLGYGPRTIGPESLDFKVEESDIPGVCFSLEPRRDGPLFRTTHPDLVKINGRELDEETLADGDIIEIRETRIRVILKND